MVSLFWMFGAITLSLLPPMVKWQLGGDEMAVSLYLGAFAIAVALGSAFGSFLCSGRIILLPAPVATLVMGLFAADLAWTAAWTSARDRRKRFGATSSPCPQPGASASISCGLAFAGGVLAVPSFSAAQAWAPIEKRARIVGAINVLNAAFMVGGALVIAGLQAAGLDLAGAFALIRSSPASVGAIWMFRKLADQPAAGLPVDPVPRLLSARGARPRQSRQGRRQTPFSP